MKHHIVNLSLAALFVLALSNRASGEENEADVGATEAPKQEKKILTLEEIKKERGFVYVICAKDGQENRINRKLGLETVNCVKGHPLDDVKCPKDGAINKLRTPRGSLKTQCSEDGASLIFLPEDKGIDKIDEATLNTYPEEMQATYKLFSEKCSKCHSLARPLNMGFSPKDWQKYIKRMMRRPSSGISNAEAKQIYQFLKFYEGRRK